MKRHWRVGRILLAILCMSMGGFVFYAWPIGPRWRINAEQPVGFGLKQGLLFTIPDREPNEGKQFELQGYELVTGERRITYALELEGQTSGLPIHLQGILSSNGNILACFDSATSIQVFDLKQQCQRLCSIKTEVLRSLALSTDGETLALFKDFDQVEIRNSRTGHIKHQFKMPPDSVPGSFDGYICHPEHMQFSRDGHYLALGTIAKVVVIFDLIAEQILGFYLNSEIPQFLADRNVIITTPRTYQTGNAQWFEIHGLAIKKLPISHLRDAKLQGQASSPSRQLTFCWDSSDRPKLPGWIPYPIRQKLEALWGWKKKLNYFVQSIDTSTGQVRDTFSLHADRMHPGMMFGDALVSSDGLMLALKEESELCLWDIPPRRSVTCWIVCCCFAFMALWLAWPRKIKLV